MISRGLLCHWVHTNENGIFICDRMVVAHIGCGLRVTTCMGQKYSYRSCYWYAINNPCIWHPIVQAAPVRHISELRSRSRPYNQFERHRRSINPINIDSDCREHRIEWSGCGYGGWRLQGGNPTAKTAGGDSTGQSPRTGSSKETAIDPLREYDPTTVIVDMRDLYVRKHGHVARVCDMLLCKEQRLKWFFTLASYRLRLRQTTAFHTRAWKGNAGARPKSIWPGQKRWEVLQN